MSGANEVLLRGWTTCAWTRDSPAWLVLEPLRSRQQGARLWVHNNDETESETVTLNEQALRELARRLLQRADALDRARLWPRCTCPGAIAPDTSRVDPRCVEHSAGYGHSVRPLAITAGVVS